VLPVATALVTGATSGIGAAFARLLASEGYDLVLVARDADRLECIATDLGGKHGVGAEFLRADLTDDAQRLNVEARLADHDHPVDVLVNSAGIPMGRSFLAADIDADEAMLRLNILAVLRLAKAAATGMVERGHGAIINVSSVAGFLPSGTYSASKAWVTKFSEVLAVELGPKGVRVVGLCPGYVRSEFHHRAGIALRLPDWVWLSADDVAADGWRAVRSGQVVVVTDRKYAAGIALLRLVPLSAVAAGLRLAKRRGLSR
jgi:short-subunit dehydrogenase